MIYCHLILRNQLLVHFAVLGPGWLGATVFNAPQNLKIIQDDIGQTIQSIPWLVIVLVAIVAMIVISQTATASIMVLIVMSMGIPPMYFIVNGPNA